MAIDPTIFREYDIRGLVGKNLDEGVLEAIGKGTGTLMQRYGARKIAVGRDVRLSSPKFAEALIRGLRSTGCDVTDFGEVPTPVLNFGVIEYKFEGGVEITASHNPIDYNGVKMRTLERSLYGPDMQEIKKIIETGAFATGDGGYAKQDVVPAYKKKLASLVKIDRPLKIVIDAGNGACGPIAPDLFRSVGCEVTELYCEPDGRFPNHLPDPTVPALVADLVAKVKETGADLGLGFDGDGDRIGVVDETGHLLWGDYLMILLARDILKRRPGASVVFDTKCSKALIEEIDRHGGKPVIWKSGYPLIQAKMRELSAPLAGEMSGHIYFTDNFYGVDDGMFGGLRVAEIVARAGKPLSKILADAPVYPSTPELRIESTEEDKFKIVEEIAKRFRGKYETIDVDGVRVVFPDGWALLRASNTQAVIVARFEANTEARLEELKAMFRDELKKHPSAKLDF